MYLCFAETSHPYEAFVVINGHNSRNNRAVNSDMAAVINKLEKDIGVIEQLSDNKISTCINLSHIQKNQSKRKHKYTPRRNDNLCIAIVQFKLKRLLQLDFV